MSRCGSPVADREPRPTLALRPTVQVVAFATAPIRRSACWSHRRYEFVHGALTRRSVTLARRARLAAVISPGQLVTERLRLTPLVVDDATPMADVLGDERMYEFTGGHPPTVDELWARYERLAVGHSADGSELWFNWIVRLADEATPVGVMQATVVPDSSRADVAWEIGVPWQGRRFAVEAAGAVVAWLIAEGVGVVRALVHPHNAASARVAERAGLVRTPEFEEGEAVWLTPPR